MTKFVGSPFTIFLLIPQLIRELIRFRMNKFSQYFIHKINFGKTVIRYIIQTIDCSLLCIVIFPNLYIPGTYCIANL